jgi:hypothetical protein
MQLADVQRSTKTRAKKFAKGKPATAFTSVEPLARLRIRRRAAEKDLTDAAEKKIAEEDKKTNKSQEIRGKKVVLSVGKRRKRLASICASSTVIT